ncbi:MAG: FliH/SctL family protein [Peptostreptococcaceae bacterium]|nr:FliH/SctL family protein [Peptostreptococcaceae bacterium]
MFDLIKKANTDSHVISYNVLQGFDDLEEEIREEETVAEVVGYDLEALNRKKQILQDEIIELEEKASEILKNAEREAERLRTGSSRRGYEEGYEKGHSEGSDQGFEEALRQGLRRIKSDNQEILDELKRIVDRTEAKKQEILKKYQEDLKDLAIAVAEKVVHVSLKSSGDIIKRMILSATEGLQTREWAKIYIAKTDSQVLLQGDTDLLGSLSSLSDHIKIIVMEEEASGTCIIELPDKVLDASVNTQMENIREILSSGRI